ncbi:MAG TPA: D-threitol dehydrogenase [Atribacteraceae bacterium]|nr:D-threitol dehydrogenase [Atribacteraceae bacterium]
MEYKPFDINFGLGGKTALVTGAAQGIGRAIALLFAQKGADIALFDLLKEESEQVASEIRKIGRRVLVSIVDVTDTSSVQKELKRVISEFGRIDILVNNAGIARLDDAEKLTAEHWHQTIAVNLSAPFFLAQLVGRQMIEQGGGKIINLASQAGVVALDRHVAYCASKAGMISMSKVLALEWAELNINVNSISPTVILTELGKKAWAGELGEAMKQKIPVRRFGYPEEVAAVAVFLASEASNLITGENVMIDGGYTIQ